MNDILAPVGSRTTDRLTLPTTVTDAAHLTLAERLQLRFGLWLLLRSARRHRERDYDEHTRTLTNARLLDERDRVALGNYALRSVRV